MKRPMYIIVENFSDVYHIGDFEDIQEAEKYIEENGDHYHHGEKYILASRNSMEDIVENYHKELPFDDSPQSVKEFFARTRMQSE